MHRHRLAVLVLDVTHSHTGDADSVIELCASRSMSCVLQLHGEKRPSISEPRATSCTADQDLDKPVPSVKERSARYLSRTAAVSPRASPVKPMAENTKQTQVSKTTNAHNLEEDLPPPPPPGPQQEGLAPTEEQDPSFIPVPPPKETFCTFYQQQQKNELKRLYRHMHPELRNKLEVVVSKELEDMMNSDQIQALAAAEAGLQGEVQSMRWIFENWKLDSIGEHHATKKMLEDETVPGGNVKGTSSLFEHQSEQSTLLSTSKTACKNEQIKGAVHTATWLFETQPLDCLNKLYPEEDEMVEAVLKEPMQRGDVKGARLLFESCPLDALGRCNSVEDCSILKLRSEIQEQKGDVQKTVKLFQTEPCCAIRDGTGNIYEIKSICREEIQSDSVKTARWLFETQPLDLINRDRSELKSSQEKAEQESAVRGDVKAAIKSLQNAAAGQRAVDKEDVVRGDLHATLQSLEKSSINVSKGDYKAAMIYKNARQSYSVSTKKNNTESVVVSVPPSDTELPSPVAVTDREQQPSTTLSDATVTHTCKENKTNDSTDSSTTLSDATVTHTCKENKTNDSTNSSTLAKQRVSHIPPPLPPKTCEKAPSPKPAVPPKPEHLAAGSSAAQAKRPIPPPKHLREDQLAPKAQRQLPAKFTPPPLPPKPSCYQETSMTKSVETSEKESFHAEVSQNSKHMDMHCEASGVQCVTGNTAVSTKKVIKTPLQLAEEKYKHRKEGQSKDNTSNKQLTQKNPSTVNPETRGEVTEKIELVPHKTQATEEMQGFMPSYSDDSTTANEMHESFQTALQSFGGRKTGSVHVSPPTETNKGDFVTAPALPKKIKISQANATNIICTSEGKRCTEQEESITQQMYNQAQQRTTEATSSEQGSKIQSEIHTPSVQVSFNCQPKEQIEQQENKVVLRKKKTGRETEDERRQRLSFHRDEIIRGNVSAAMDIFENLKKREELQIILSKVEEFEGETFKVDVRSLKKLFENVPEWIVVPSKKVRQIKPKEQKKVERIEPKKDDTESTSSVELVFEDLERASEEIIHLKEQTLARLMDIEESIRKALFSVSNLKSESDIAGLSGLFKESLGTEQCSSSSSNIRKISISTNKAETENTKQVSGRNKEEDVVLRGKSDQVQNPTLEIPTGKPRASSPSSPSYISIQSAARKTKVAMSEKQGAADLPQSNSSNTRPAVCEPRNADVSRQSDPLRQATLNNVFSPLSPRRQKSMLELKTVPEAAGRVGTKTVTEKYEETDCFGNKIITSKTSTTVTKQSETNTSSTYEVVANPAVYEVMTSPLVKRPLRHSAENRVNEGGMVCVTFGTPKADKNLH
ncbi:UNVERIFIED_CONTAM: hypothetical protein FKN15_074506 [Acipenser sinensis]